MGRRPQRVRVRLTLWFVLVSAAVLAAYLATAMLVLRLQLRGVVERLAVQDIETVEGLLAFLPDGRLEVREDFHNNAQWRQTEERYLEVLGEGGTVLYRNDRLDGRNLGGPPLPGEGVAGYSVRSAVMADGTEIVLASRRHVLDGHALLIRLAYDKSLYLHQWKETLVALLLALPIGLLGVACAGFKMAGWAFDPIAAIARRAAGVGSQSLHERLEVDDREGELADLARVINAMLDRIEAGYTRLGRFTSDASHQLRTPLAALRSAGEVGLQTNGGVERHRETIGTMLEEIGRLASLVDELLTLSRADAGQIRLRPAAFAALPWAREVAALLEVLAEEKGIGLRVEGDAEAVVLGDRMHLRQALINVVHNAIKFAPSWGAIVVRVGRAEGGVSVTVDDNGPGLAPGDAAHVFERFYRSPQAPPGAGLGLAIAHWAVTAHSGRLEMENLPAGGCRVHFLLPAATSSPRSAGRRPGESPPAP